MSNHQVIPGSPVYLILMLMGVIGGAIWWSRKFRGDSRLIQIYAGGIVGAFAGAKLGYILAEGWLYRDSETFWLQLANGKTILGALLGGYAGVEGVKWLVGYRKPTGDWFAAAVPLGIALGRLGCLAHGCCLGVECEPAWFSIEDQAGTARWPAPVAELIFNLSAAAVFLQMRRHHLLPGQHFHLYLIAYGPFRFAHEFIRDTPEIVAGQFSGYHFLSLGVAALGFWGFRRRAARISSNLDREPFAP